MDVVIAYGRKIVSDEVRALTEEKVGRLGHLCPGLDRAEVHFSEEHNPRIADRECCEVIMSVPRADHPGPGRWALPPGRRRPGGGEARAPAGDGQGPAGRPFPAPPPSRQLDSALPAGAHRLTAGAGAGDAAGAPAAAGHVSGARTAPCAADRSDPAADRPERQPGGRRGNGRVVGS